MPAHWAVWTFVEILCAVDVPTYHLKNLVLEQQRVQKKIGTPNGFWITTDEICLCALQYVHDTEHEKFGNYIKIYEDKLHIHENTHELNNTWCKFV